MSLYEHWYKNEWLPLARDLTNQLAVLSRHLAKQEKHPSREALDALSDKFVDIRENLSSVNGQLIELETRHNA